MTQYHIVTDSTADLPLSLIKEFGIKVVPLRVLFGDEAFREGIDINSQQFFEKLAAADKLPSTSQPSPGDFCAVYEELTADGSAVISIHISRDMSGTCQAAQVARNTLPERDITVIDSRQVCMALGLVVLAAARAAKEGKSKEEILDIIEYTKNNMHTYFVVDTLEYLQKGGRIGRAAALLGTVLNIKPVLTLEDGMIAPFEKIRGKGKALDKILELVGDFSKDHKPLKCAIVHGNCLEEAIKFHEKLINRVDHGEHIICDIGAVVGTHAGPGTIAVFYYEDKAQE